MNLFLSKSTRLMQVIRNVGFVLFACIGIATVGIQTARPVDAVDMTLRCHCWRGTAAQHTTYCISFNVQIGVCGDEALHNAREWPEVLRVYPDVAENLHCDAEPHDGISIPESQFHAGTGAVDSQGHGTDRCPSSPPPFNLRDLPARSLPTINRIDAVAGTVIGNQTRITNGATQQQVDAARQEAARQYNRNFPNPLPGLTLQAAIGGVINIAVGLVGIFFLVVFVWGSFLYMTAAGDPKQVESGKKAIKGAVIGLVIVMVSYTAVSLIISTANDLMGTAPAPTISQENGTSEVNASGPPRTPTGGDFATTTSDGLQACRTWYAGDPALCPPFLCPAGASNLNDLIRIWGAHLPGGNVPTSQDACRACIQDQIQNLSGRYPGLDNTCMPAVGSAWNGECSNTCIDVNYRTAGQSVGAPIDTCSPATYNLSDVTCTRCLERARAEMRRGSGRARDAIRGLACGSDQGKELVWCAIGHPGWLGPDTDVCTPRTL